MVYDFHTHSIHSDGVLTVAELIRRAETRGYKALGITDHVDPSNLEVVIAEVTKACRALRGHVGILAVPGVEITHMPPDLIADLIAECRGRGCPLVVVHGESPVEPVKPGTNRAAILGGADILAHPGLITDEDAALAREKGIFIELSGRRGHCLANGHVAARARAAGVPLVVSSDAHLPEDLLDEDSWTKVALGADLGRDDLERIVADSARLAASLELQVRNQP